MILTGRMMDAEEAERAGLVSRIVPAAILVEEAIAAAKKIAGQSALAVMMNKEMVQAAYETTLTQGVALERRLFPFPFRLRRSEGGNGRLRRQAKTCLQGPVDSVRAPPDLKLTRLVARLWSSQTEWLRRACRTLFLLQLRQPTLQTAR